MLDDEGCETIVDEFVLHSIKNTEMNECNNVMDKMTIVFELALFNYSWCKMRAEEVSITSYHLLQNIKVSDAAETNDGLVKKMEKNQVM